LGIMAAITIVGKTQAHTALSQKMLNPAEDAHLKSMSTFEADEHLQCGRHSQGSVNGRKVSRLPGVLSARGAIFPTPRPIRRTQTNEAPAISSAGVLSLSSLCGLRVYRLLVAQQSPIRRAMTVRRGRGAGWLAAGASVFNMRKSSRRLLCDALTSGLPAVATSRDSS
jgi:hypothetical protein